MWFSEELEKISWEQTTRDIYEKTDADVRRALAKKTLIVTGKQIGRAHV